MLKFTLSSLCLVGFSFAAQAKVLECQTPEDGLINSPYIFGYDEGSSNATAYDPVIHTFVGEPIDATLEESGEKLVFKWRVLVHIKGDQTAVTYRASYFPKTGKFMVRGTPGPEFGGQVEGRGTCTVKK